jgi:hypothetical protein
MTRALSSALALGVAFVAHAGAAVLVLLLLAPTVLCAIVCEQILTGGDIEYGDSRDAARAASLVATAPAVAQECPICLAHAEAPVALACGHAFHLACVDRWLAHDATCPMCRRRLENRKG